MRGYPFSLRQLQYLVAVVDEGGFRRAAKACHVAQPSLSAQIAQVETLLGFAVFERASPKPMLTRPGEEVLVQARRVLLASDDLMHAAQRSMDPLAGPVRLGIIPTVSPYLLPELVPALRAELPRLKPQWREEKTATCLQALREGTLDAAVLAQQSGLEGFVHMALGDDGFVLAMALDHPLAHEKGPVTMPQLDGNTVLLLDEGHCFRDQSLEICATRDVREADFRATSLSTLAQMVAGGAGVTLLPRLSLTVENRRGDLCTRAFNTPEPYRPIVLVWRVRSPLGDAFTRIASVMQRACARVLDKHRG